MADSSNIILEEDSVKLVGTGESPVVDIVGENNWNLSQSDGDVRIGKGDNRLAIGVSLGGAGEGISRLRAKGGTEQLKLGAGDTDTVNIQSTGMSIDGHLDLLPGGDLRLDDNSALIARGNVLFTGKIAISADFLGDLIPFTSGYDIGESGTRWETLYVNHVNESSDRRLKTDIEELDGGLETLLNLRPVSYSLKGNGSETHLGLIGQEVAEVLPEIVNRPEDDDGYLGLNYTELVAVLIDAIQTQHDEQERLGECVDRQQDQIDDQQERIEDLEKRLAVLENAE